jgi:hypothetical protein
LQSQDGSIRWQDFLSPGFPLITPDQVVGCACNHLFHPGDLFLIQIKWFRLQINHGNLLFVQPVNFFFDSIIKSKQHATPVNLAPGLADIADELKQLSERAS